MHQSQEINVLSFHDDLFLSKDHEIVQKVANGNLIYEKLIINGTFNLFDENFKESDEFQTFMKKLEDSVNYLKVNSHDNDGVLEYLNFTNLYELNISTGIDINPLSKLIQNNPLLEQIALEDELIRYEDETQAFSIKHESFQILTMCESLKTITVRCLIPLDETLITDLFNEINDDYFEMNHVKIAYDQIPHFKNYSNYVWVVTKLSLNKNFDTRTLIVEPLAILDVIREEYEECEKNCSFDHQAFRIESVKELFFYAKTSEMNRCKNYYKTCFKSFPFLTKLFGWMEFETSILHLMSSLHHLSEVGFVLKNDYTTPSHLGFLENLKTVRVIFESTSLKTVETFAKSCSNIQTLTIIIKKGIFVDDSLIIIARHFRKLESLEIDCARNEITRLGLMTIGNCLKRLQRLEISSFPDESDIFKLLHQLDNLEQITCLTEKFHKKDFDTKNGTSNPVPEVPTINELPNNVLKHVFSYLDENDQSNCRNVNSRWRRTSTTRSMIIHNQCLVINQKLSDEMIALVINEDAMFDTLIIQKMSVLYWLESDTYRRFMTKLGNCVVCLQIQDIDVVGLCFFSFFTNLQELWIPNNDSHIIARCCQYSSELEALVWFQQLVGYDVGTDEFTIHDELVQTLTEIKSFKTITVDCSFPLEMNIISEIFYTMNERLFGMTNIIFDCEPIPCWSDYPSHYLMVTRMQMEVNDETFIIKPLRIREVYREGHDECEEPCRINHLVFQSESVTELIFDHDLERKCYGYYESIIKSFPKITRINAYILRQCNQHFLHLMSHLSLLTTCDLYLSTNPSCWKRFPKLTTLKIEIDSTSIENFELLIKSCLNVTSLTIQVDDGITTDECVNIIVHHLRKLEHLSLECLKGEVTRMTLITIGNELNELKYLKIFCSERERDIRRLFDVLPKLETIKCGTKELGKHDEISYHEIGTTSDTSEREMESVSSTSWINEPPDIDLLPNEVLERIFAFLNQYDQLMCRQVNQRWFEIFSSSTELNRVLNLSNSFLSWETNPVKTLYQTQFKYNRIELNRYTNYGANEDLSEFWRIIGMEVQELSIDGHEFTNAFKTGLTAAHFTKLTRLSINSLALFVNPTSEDTIEWMTILNQIQSLVLRISLVPFDAKTITEQEMSHVTTLQFIIDLEGDRELDPTVQFLDRITFPNVTKFMIYPFIHFPLESLFGTKVPFNQIKTLYIGKESNWDAKDFNQILTHCSSLECLIIGLYFKSDHNNISKELEERLEPSSSARIAKVMFDKLVFLCDIYFVAISLHDNQFSVNLKPFKSYSRQGINGIESHDNFVDFLEDRINPRGLNLILKCKSGKI